MNALSGNVRGGHARTSITPGKKGKPVASATVLIGSTPLYSLFIRRRQAMSGRIVFFGYGPVGRAIAARLLAEGREVLVAQRKEPPGLPNGLAFTPLEPPDRSDGLTAARAPDPHVAAIGLP